MRSNEVCKHLILLFCLKSTLNFLKILKRNHRLQDLKMYSLTYRGNETLFLKIARNTE